LDPAFDQSGGNAVGVAVEFRKGNGAVSSFAIGLGNGNVVGKAFGNVNESGSNVWHGGYCSNKNGWALAPR
jgi:hypothetical protein